MKTKWADKTRALILSGEVPEGNIRSMRMIMAKVFNRGSPSCTEDDACELIELIELHKPLVTASQARKGADWLYNAAFTSKGEQRATEFAQQFHAQDLQVVRALKERPRFRLIGFEDAREYQRYCVLFPIYRAYGNDGSFFDYVARSWQAGGRSYVINRA